MIRIHKEGYKFLSVLFILGFSISLVVLMLDLSQWIKLTIIFLIAFEFLFFLQFFRSPIINKNLGENKIISPANGKVVYIGEVYEDEYFREKKLMVSIFMSPMDVHINRNPISGIVKYYKYHKGKYLVAWHPKSSKLNERTTTVIKNDKTEIMVRQIAGFLARRIVNYSKEGANVKQCDQLGFIKFGSRADIFLPLGTKVFVKENQKTVSGETQIASLV
jgi:phosphatidylserine decarboxylase